MKFTEWYKATKGQNWHSDFASMYNYAEKVSREYESYCKKNKVSPVWDG